jgi:hypothetical protein
MKFLQPVRFRLLSPSLNFIFDRPFLTLCLAAAGMLAMPGSGRAAQSALLTWNGNTAPTVAGYNVHYGTSSGNYTSQINVGNVTSATISNLNAGSIYYFVVTAYSSANSESAASNEASFSVPMPTVSLTGVSDGEKFNAGSITLNANASETGGSISKVCFYNGSTEIAETTSAPFSVAWNGAQPGSYSITAVAYDNTGVAVSSSNVAVTVVPFNITGLQRQADGSSRLNVVGAAGRTNSIYVSNDLQNWTLLTTAVNSTGTLVVSDPGASSMPKRFYKAVSN